MINLPRPARESAQGAKAAKHNGFRVPCRFFSRTGFLF
jgi:hypothetical protein